MVPARPRPLFALGVLALGAGCFGASTIGGKVSDADVPDALVRDAGPGAGSVRVFVGDDVGCAIRGEEVFCWGSRRFGSLGDGMITSDAFAEVPVRVPIVRVPVGTGSLAVGSWHACASSGTDVRCWGIQTHHELGVADAGDVCGVDRCIPSPVVAFAADVRALAVGYRHSCMLEGANGRVACWGAAMSWALGLAPRSVGLLPGIDGGSSVTPVEVLSSGGRELDAGTDYACVRDVDGRVSCWGASYVGQCGVLTSLAGYEGTPPVRVPDLEGTLALSVGNQHACVVTADGGVACWGYDGGLNGEGPSGALGHDPAIDRRPSVGQSYFLETPIRVQGLDRVLSVSAAADHTCALVADGSVFCWGRNRFGALGHDPALDLVSLDASTPGVPYQPKPTRVERLPPIAHLRAGGLATCGVDFDDRIWCWPRLRTRMGAVVYDGHAPEELRLPFE